MEKEQQIQKYVQLFSEAAIQHKDGTSKGNSRKTNRAYENLKKIVHEMQKNEEIFDEVLQILLHHQDIRIKMAAAEKCLLSKKYTNIAYGILKDVQNDPTLDPLLRFTAKMDLEVLLKKS